MAVLRDIAASMVAPADVPGIPFLPGGESKERGWATLPANCAGVSAAAAGTAGTGADGHG